MAAQDQNRLSDVLDWALSGRGGLEARQLRVAEEYVKQFGKLADEASSTLVVPATISDISSMIALATNVIKKQS